MLFYQRVVNQRNHVLRSIIQKSKFEEKLIMTKEMVRFENPTQIINMGGPWIGDLFIEKKNYYKQRNYR